MHRESFWFHVQLHPFSHSLILYFSLYSSVYTVWVNPSFSSRSSTVMVMADSSATSSFLSTFHSLSIPQCTPCGSIRRSHRGHPRSWSWQIPQQPGSSSGSLCTDSTLRPTGPTPGAPQWRPTHRR